MLKRTEFTFKELFIFAMFGFVMTQHASNFLIWTHLIFNEIIAMCNGRLPMRECAFLATILNEILY